MAEPYFEIKKSGLIQIWYRCEDGSRFVKSTGESIKPKHWNKRTQRANSSYEAGALELNNFLDSFEKKLKRIILRIKTDDLIPTRELITKYWEESDVKKNFLKYLQTIIDNPATLKRKGKTPGVNRMKIYSGLKAHIEAMEKKFSKTYSFQDINEDFYNELIDYLQEKENPCNDASVSKYIKALIAIMNLATKKELNTNLIYRDREIFAIPSDDQSEKIFLTEEEILKIYKKEFTSERLTRERDAIVLGASMGLRHSDFVRIKPHNFTKQEDGYYLTIADEKESNISKVPVNALALEILEKYKFEAPSTVSNQKRNEAIKEVLKEAKIDQLVLTYNTFKGKKREIVKPKYQLASTHTLRRSCVTNLYLKKFPTFSIMKIWGWKSEKAFLRYIRVDQLMASKELMKFYHEQGEMLRVV